jgi:hypothetical protein
VSISLEKRTENAGVSLVKVMTEAAEKGLNVDDLSAACVLAMDFSGSMDYRYRSGEVQQLAERTLALALAGLDDDGNIQVHFFHHKVFPEVEVDTSNYQGAVDEFTRKNQMGGTAYAPVIQQIIDTVGGTPEKKGLFKKKAAVAPGGPAMPVLVFFVTDGEPSDRSETIRLLKDASGLPIFWQFLGVGYSPSFLQELDTMGGRVIDNVGLTEVSSTESMSDEEYYETVLKEFVTSWVPEARAKGIIA